MESHLKIEAKDKINHIKPLKYKIEKGDEKF